MPCKVRSCYFVDAKDISLKVHRRKGQLSPFIFRDLFCFVNALIHEFILCQALSSASHTEWNLIQYSWKAGFSAASDKGSKLLEVGCRARLCGLNSRYAIDHAALARYWTSLAVISFTVVSLRRNWIDVFKTKVRVQSQAAGRQAAAVGAHQVPTSCCHWPWATLRNCLKEQQRVWLLKAHLQCL